MLTKIVHNSSKLCAFLDPLIESLSEPQRQHLRDLCDALLVCESEHTLAALQRQFVETTDASNWADFLRISPWSAQRVRAELLETQITFAIEQGEKRCQAKEIYLNIDDSIGQKHRFETCKAAMRALSDLRNDAWRQVRAVRERSTMIARDSRRAAALESDILAGLRSLVGQSDEIAARTHEAFHGLMPELWITRYLAERLEPLKAELVELTQRVVGSR